MKGTQARPILIALGAAIMLALCCPPALAQCAMCKVSAVGGGAMGRDLNTAILVLLIPPVTLFCAIFIVAYRYRMAPGETTSQNQEKKTGRAWSKKGREGQPKEERTKRWQRPGGAGSDSAS